MAWTQADLDKLDAALSAAGGGMQRLKFGDQEFEFRSVDEMLKLRAVMASALNTAAGTPTNHRYAATSKGL